MHKIILIDSVQENAVMEAYNDLLYIHSLRSEEYQKIAKRIMKKCAKKLDKYKKSKVSYDEIMHKIKITRNMLNW